jgi:hypothetical protein
MLLTFAHNTELTVFPAGTSTSMPQSVTADSVESTSALYVWHRISFKTHCRKPVPSRSVMNISDFPIITADHIAMFK